MIRWPNHILQIPELKRPPMEGKIKISKKEYLSNQTIFYKFLNWRQPPMEDNIKISKKEYLSNHLLDHTQILYMSLDDKTIFYKNSKWRRPPMEDDLKILKREYLSLSLDYQTIFYKSLKWRWTQWKTTSGGKMTSKPAECELSGGN